MVFGTIPWPVRWHHVLACRARRLQGIPSPCRGNTVSGSIPLLRIGSPHSILTRLSDRIPALMVAGRTGNESVGARSSKDCHAFHFGRPHFGASGRPRDYRGQESLARRRILGRPFSALSCLTWGFDFGGNDSGVSFVGSALHILFSQYGGLKGGTKY